MHQSENPRAGGSPAVKGLPGSWLFVLSCDCSDCLLGVFDVFQCELAGLNQVRHHRFGPAAKKVQLGQAGSRRPLPLPDVHPREHQPAAESNDWTEGFAQDRNRQHQRGQRF
jgi:hypothetical protein